VCVTCDCYTDQLSSDTAQIVLFSSESKIRRSILQKFSWRLSWKLVSTVLEASSGGFAKEECAYSAVAFPIRQVLTYLRT
jgi:hypothetical protein